MTYLRKGIDEQMLINGVRAAIDAHRHSARRSHAADLLDDPVAQL
jgi:hypothetical protein